MLDALSTYDWAAAFVYAVQPEPAPPGALVDTSPVLREEVAEITHLEEGENDGPSWIIYGRLNGGRWFSLEASCDYTGWDCQAGGDAAVALSREDIERYGLSDSARKRFDITLSEEAVQP